MEWKIGEIRQINGEWCQCIEGCYCTDCVFNFSGACTNSCLPEERVDGKRVIFKKLEKVGEPYGYFVQGAGIIMVQEYILANSNYIWDYNQGIVIVNCPNERVTIEIKQTKEDMEGKTNLYEKQTPLQKLMEIYCDGRMDYNEFEKKVKELYSDKGDDSKPILKPFDLEAAKQGKSVCTRDGRKARIICFDRNDLYPIVALIECEDGKEIIGAYSKEGQTEIYEIKGTNLMMLPEKKDGWAVIRREDVYETEEQAKKSLLCSRTATMIRKIEWEE